MLYNAVFYQCDRIFSGRCSPVFLVESFDDCSSEKEFYQASPSESVWIIPIPEVIDYLLEN